MRTDRPAARGGQTRLSRLHPYPAMVEDGLARTLVARHVSPGDRVLDPFCGSARLLAAADCAGDRVGLDVNPLAWLIASAKLANASALIVGHVADALPAASSRSKLVPVCVPGHTGIWFSPDVAQALDQLTAWIAALDLPRAEMLVVAAALSATVRDVSFARKGGWKLHRLSAEDRATFSKSPWKQMAKRLAYCRRELAVSPLSGRSSVILADVRMHAPDTHGQFDVVLTSPPYGDSRTTVQYGAASALCLSYVSHLPGLSELAIPGCVIDGACLGGSASVKEPLPDCSQVWQGDPETPEGRRLLRFLKDYRSACGSIATATGPKGKAVVVVGRRSTGGHRVLLDDYTVACLHDQGMRLIERSTRDVVSKRVPSRVNRFARCKDLARRSAGIVDTMNSESVLVFSRD